MTNREIIEEIIDFPGANLKVEDLKTYAVWKSLGYQVRKGEKALIQADLWVPYKKSGKEESNLEADEKSGFIKKKSSLFHITQVDKIEK